MLVAILFLLKTEEEKIKTRPPNVLYEVIQTWDGESEDDLDLYVKAAEFSDHGHMHFPNLPRGLDPRRKKGLNL